MEADGGDCCWRSPGDTRKGLRRPKQAGGTLREERRATSDGLNDLGLGPELIDEMAQMQRLTHTFGGA
jgi:hypothetical protein